MTSDIKTEVTPTHLGDVDFEVVECASCESDVLKREAMRFVAGDLRRKYDRMDYKQYRFKKGSVVDGWLCPYCVEEGPINLPAPRLIDFVKDLTADDLFFAFMWSLIGIVGLMVIVLMLSAIAGVIT